MKTNPVWGKRPRKLLSLLLALVMTFSTVSTALAATSTVEVNPIGISGAISFSYYKSDGSLVFSGGSTGAAVKNHYVDGKYALCLEPNRDSANNVNYDSSGWPELMATDEGKKANLLKAMSYSCPNNGDTSNASKQAAQLLAWSVCCGYVDGNGNAIGGRSSPFYAAITDATVRSIYDASIDKMRSNGLPAGVSLSTIKLFTTSWTYDGTRNYQALAYLDVPPQKGALELTKTSAVPAITNGNSCYSFAGAVFGVYTSYDNARAGVNGLGTFTTGSDGKGKCEGLDAGTYYVRELTAPPGYALSGEVKSVTVTAGETATVTFADVPQSDPVGILLRKLDGRTADGSATRG